MFVEYKKQDNIVNKQLVSVLMPVYNGERYIKQAMDSVLAQTFTDFEFLIINDGSTDRTQGIIDSYKDSRIKCHQQANQGVAQTLNNGLKLATGKFIWRHDADDICLPEQLQTQMDFLAAYPNFALVSTQIAFMSDRGKIAHDFKQPKDAYFQGQPFMKVKREQFNPYSPITHATVLVKKEVFDTVGVYRTQFKTSEDTDLWLRIIEHFDAAVLHYCSYFVRLNSTSATQRYKGTSTFYRDLAYQLADERLQTGNDILQRGEDLPIPEAVKSTSQDIEKSSKFLNGRLLRDDLLNFRYKLMLNAKDYKNVFAILQTAIKDGWKLKATYKSILFPLLGDKLIATGVKLKKHFK